jgi:tRNA-specific 2-thiouridylase
MDNLPLIKKKIFVGISGGVDSSVAALLLKQQGYEVHGVFVKTWSPEWVPCTWVEEKRDAMRICAALDIPFHFLDATEQYKQGVADYMIAEYRAGRTPNPDVLCNKVIKFGAMWDYAKTQGADGIATGHYARTNFFLQKAADPSKDQSYFLWMIPKEVLPHIQFPIGHLKKHEVRSIAEKAGLFTATKKDSQGICFLGDIDMKDFLGHYIDQKPGQVLNEQGKVIGEHDGVWFYTMGERHGFRITEKNTERTPYYVIAKDIHRNTLTVSSVPQGHGYVNRSSIIELRDTNWFIAPEIGKVYTAQIRYHGSLIEAVFTGLETIMLHTSEAIPLGQSIVVYDGENVMGGAILGA